MMDALSALRLQIEWGADEGLADAPLDRFARPLAPASAPEAPAPAAPAARLAANNLDELYAAWAAFEGCPLRATATNTVRADGNPAAPWVIIGDAPGSDDDRSGRAFSGKPGEMLDRVLGSVGLHRSGMLLAHLVPWRPPGNRPLSEAEIRSCVPFVQRLLAIVRPQRLLLLGAAPVRALAGSTEPVRRLRGRWLPVVVVEENFTIQARALPPPDQWLRSGTSKQELWSDLIQLTSS